MGRLTAIWNCCFLSIFSYTGCEAVGIMAAEATQRETLPKAVKRISTRLILYYLGGNSGSQLDLVCRRPYPHVAVHHNSETLPRRPYYHVTEIWDTFLPHIVNVVMIIVALPAADVDLYVTVVPDLLMLMIRVDVSSHLRKETMHSNGS